MTRFATPDSQGLAAFFSAERRENETITNYLARLKSLLTSAYPNQTILCGDLIKNHILDSLDPQTRLVFYPYENSDLASLAFHADTLLAMVNSTSQSTSSVTSSPILPTQRIIIEMFESRLDQIDNALSSHPQPSSIHLHSQCHHVFTFSSALRPNQDHFLPMPVHLPHPCALISGLGSELYGVAEHRVLCSVARPSFGQKMAQHLSRDRGLGDSSPLFFVREHRLNIQMLVDTGAACSLLPLSCIDYRSLTNADRETLSSIGLGSIPAFGISLQRIY